MSFFQFGVYRVLHFMVSILIVLWITYYRRLFNNSFSGNHQQFWKYIRAKRQDNYDIPTLLINDQSIHSAKGKANALNNHFKSIFTKENLSIIPTMYIVTLMYLSCLTSLFPNLEYISYLQLLMNTRLVHGPDHITSYILKHCAIRESTMKSCSMGIEWLWQI